MTVRDGSQVTERVDINTTRNTTYEMMKHHGQGGRLEKESISSPPGSPPPNVDEKYEVVSLPTFYQILKAIPPPVAPPTLSNVGVAGEVVAI